jgi:uncharacterized membrane protein YfcA
MIPLMLTIPALVGLEPLSMKVVAGLSMLQVFFSSLSGLIVHKKNNFVHLKMLLLIGTPMGISSFGGAYLSRYFDDRILLILFELLIVIAISLLLWKKNSPLKNATSDEVVNVKHFNSIFMGFTVGTFSGIVGAGGGFILIPLMITLLKIPTKITIGTSLGIVFIGSLMGGLGKIVSLQTDIMMALPLIVGSIISANIGANTSKFLSAGVLHILFMAMIIISGIQVLFRFF